MCVLVTLVTLNNILRLSFIAVSTRVRWENLVYNAICRKLPVLESLTKSGFVLNVTIFMKSTYCENGNKNLENKTD